MSGKAANVPLTEKQQEVLTKISCSTTVAQRLAQRARVILLAFAGALNVAIAIEVGLSRKQVGCWRRRWQQSFGALVSIECSEPQAMLRRTIEEVLSDAPRRGSPGTYSAEQVTQIIAIACEPPSQSGRPIETWTGWELADEAIQRGIVKSISTSQVNRYLAEADLHPQRSKYWLNSTEKDPEVFNAQVQTVCKVTRRKTYTHEDGFDITFRDSCI